MAEAYEMSKYFQQKQPITDGSLIVPGDSTLNTVSISAMDGPLNMNSFLVTDMATTSGTSSDAVNVAYLAANYVPMVGLANCSQDINLGSHRLKNVGIPSLTGDAMPLSYLGQIAVNIVQTGSTTWSTGTGAISLNGPVTLSGGSTLTMNTGSFALSGSINQSGSTTWSTGTGGVSLNGSVTLAASMPFNMLGGGTVNSITPSTTTGSLFNIGATTLAEAVGTSNNRAGIVFNAPTFSATSGSSTCNASTVCINGGPVAGTGCTLTSYALNVTSGNSLFNGNVTLVGSSSLTLNTGNLATSGGITMAGSGTFSTASGTISLNGPIQVATGTPFSMLGGGTISAITPSQTIGSLFNIGATTLTETVGSTTSRSAITFNAPTLSASSGTSTVPTAATVYINGAPIAGTNTTLTNAYALDVVGGSTFAGNVAITGSSTFSTSSGAVTLGGTTSVQTHATIGSFDGSGAFFGCNLTSGNYTTNYGFNQNTGGNVNLNTPSGGGFGLFAGGSQFFVINSSQFNPWTDNTITFGNSSHRFTAVYAVGGVITTSDGNLKTNVTPLDNTQVYNFINKLNPVSYNWIDSFAHGNTNTMVGMIAQSIITAATDSEFICNDIVEVVTDETTGVTNYGVNYSEFIPPMITYMQQLPNNLLPSADATTNIGSATLRYENIYLSGGIINTSDATQKENVQDIAVSTACQFITKLEPKLYNMIGNTNMQRYGLLAQDVEKVMYGLGMSGIVHKNVDPKTQAISYGLNYNEILPHLITYAKDVGQKLEAEIEKNKILETRLQKLETLFDDASGYLKDNARIKNKISSLQSPRKSASSSSIVPPQK